MAKTNSKKDQNKDNSKKKTQKQELPVDESKAFEDIFDHIDVDSVDTNHDDDSITTENVVDKKDDLTKIEWIWPKIQDLFYKEKIFTFEDLSKQTPWKIRIILANAGGHFKSHDPSTRPEQARLAHAGKRAELDALQEYLNKGKKAKEKEEKNEEKTISPDTQTKDKQNKNKEDDSKIASLDDNSKEEKTDAKSTQKKPKKTRAKKVKTWDTTNNLDIDDISSYIEKTKEEQKIQDATPYAQDGTDLTTLPDLYAVVPHSKWEHKLVYLREDAPSTLLDDEKWRTKWGVYKKKWMKIYDVHVDFKEHPLLKSKNGELLDTWIIDSPDDLTLQLQAIRQGKCAPIASVADFFLLRT